MRDEDLPRVVELAAALSANFSREADHATYEAFKLGLADVPIEAIERAVSRAFKTCKFMPSIAELRELAGEMRPEHRAVRAWQAVMDANRRHGYYESVDFDDKVINATIRTLGGWMRFAERYEAEEEKWFRKEFEQTYVALMQAGVGAEQARPLIGFFDRDNSTKGYSDAVKEPLLIETGLPPQRPGLIEDKRLIPRLEVTESEPLLPDLRQP